MVCEQGQQHRYGRTILLPQQLQRSNGRTSSLLIAQRLAIEAKTQVVFGARSILGLTRRRAAMSARLSTYAVDAPHTTESDGSAEDTEISEISLKSVPEKVMKIQESSRKQRKLNATLRRRNKTLIIQKKSQKISAPVLTVQSVKRHNDTSLKQQNKARKVYKQLKNARQKLLEAVQNGLGGHNIIHYFKQLDHNNSGTINYTQFEATLRRVCVLRPADVRVLWNTSRKGGKVKYMRFMEVIAGREKALQMANAADKARNLIIVPPKVMTRTRGVLDGNPAVVIARTRDLRSQRHKQIVLRAVQSSMTKRNLTDVGRRRRDFAQWLTLNTVSA